MMEEPLSQPNTEKNKRKRTKNAFIPIFRAKRSVDNFVNQQKITNFAAVLQARQVGRNKNAESEMQEIRFYQHNV